MPFFPLPGRDAARPVGTPVVAVIRLAVVVIIAAVVLLSSPVLLLGFLLPGWRTFALRLLRELRTWVVVVLHDATERPRSSRG